MASARSGAIEYRTGDNVADYLNLSQNPPGKATWGLGASPSGFGFGRSVSVTDDSAFYGSYTPSAISGQYKLQTDYFNLKTDFKYTLSYDIGAGAGYYPLSFAHADGDWSLTSQKGLNLFTSLTKGCSPSRIRPPASGGTTPIGGGTMDPCENIATIGGRAGGSLGGNGLLTPAAFAGNWSGTWNNTTYDTTGPITLSATANATAKTYSATLTLGGEVFGGSPPPAADVWGARPSAQTGPMASHRRPSARSRSRSAPAALFPGASRGIPNPNLSGLDFSGTISPTMISLDYTITFSQSAGGGTAEGTATLSKH